MDGNHLVMEEKRSRVLWMNLFKDAASLIDFKMSIKAWDGR